MAQDGDRSLVRQGLEAEAAARAVIDDAEQKMRTAGLVGLAGAIHAPDDIGFTGAVGAPPELPALKADLRPVVTHDAPDEIVADGVFFFVAPVEDVLERAAVMT